jgi:O-antigen ligase
VSGEGLGPQADIRFGSGQRPLPDADGVTNLTLPDEGTARGRSAWALWLLLGFVIALALVPDGAVLRSKIVWAQALLLTAACVALGEQALRGALRLHWQGFLFAGLAVVAVAAVLFLLPGTLVSRSLARDEVLRLALLPLGAWTVGSSLRSPANRRLFLLVLQLSVIPVAGYALAQNLAGVLDLPIDRAARAASTFGNPLFLAAFLVLTTPLCAAGALFGSGANRWAGALATGLAMPALLAAQSRWAWLGFAISLAVGVVLLAPDRRTRRNLLIALGAAGAIVAAITIPVLTRPQSHALIWRDTWAMIQSAPWGIGPGQFPVAFLPYASPELLAAYPRPEVIVNDAHSEPLQILAELGWPGFLALLFSVALLARSALDTLRRVAMDDAERPMLVAGLAALCGAGVQSLGSPDLRFVSSTMTFAAVIGFCASFAPPSTWTLRGGRPARMALVLVALAGLILVGRTTWDRHRIAELIRPPPAFEVSPGNLALIASLQEDVAANPDDPERHYTLGVAFAAEYQYADAATAFGAAARLAPGNPGVLRSLGIAEGLAGHFAPSVRNLRASLAVTPDDPTALYVLAYSAYGMGDLRTCIESLEALLVLDPEHPQGRLLLARLRE